MPPSPGGDQGGADQSAAHGVTQQAPAPAKQPASGAEEENGNWEADPSPFQRWAAAKAQVMDVVATSKAFNTLRDMSGGIFINPSQLEPIKTLGAGAFATVEQAWYSPAGGGDRYIVAVKRLRSELFRNQADLELFEHEVELMRKLRHRNIVDFVAAGEVTSENDATAFVVQEFMAGGTLKQLVTKQMLANGRRVYSDADGLEMCLQMARGLRYLHRARPMIIHRDLKLENVLLKADKPDKDGKWEVKLADFGLSRRVQVKQAAIALLRQQSTATRTASRSTLTPVNSAPAASIASKTSSGWTGARQASRKMTSVGTSQEDLESVWSSRVKASFINSRPPSLISSTAAVSLHGHAGGTGQQQPLFPTVEEVEHRGSMAYVLTGRTGSLMYMSPEVFHEQPYSEKADVFSYAMMAYEVLHKYVMLSAVAVKGTYEELEQYCARVAGGYRPPIHKTLPESIHSLIEACWAQDPAARPSMDEVVQRLEAIQAAGEIEAMPAATGCSCTIC